LNLRTYYTSTGKNLNDIVPVTVLLPDEKETFKALYEPKQIWIVKPAENTNRGKGI